MSTMFANRATRRRAVTFTILLSVSLILMAIILWRPTGIMGFLTEWWARRAKPPSKPPSVLAKA